MGRGGFAGMYYDEAEDVIVIPGAEPRPGDVYAYFKEAGFHFPRTVITSYVLSLATKPFVILTGISGTGKTKIAQLFARYVAEGEEGRHAFVSVRPDWTDNRGILGFYNLLTQQYQPTEVLRVLLCAHEELARAREEGRTPRPYFVILDEMNLAKVEQYFSDFLSCMESRLGGRGEPLCLHDQPGAVPGPGHEGADLRVPPRLVIPENLYVTGTVNVDETTYMFSPKVLDRANVIEFNEVDLRGYVEGGLREEPFPVVEFFDPDVRRLVGTAEPATRADYEAFERLWRHRHGGPNPLPALHDLLASDHLHFGYRVANEMARFVCLGGGTTTDEELVNLLDLQVLQKILPRFHGTLQRLGRPLARLFWFCEKLADAGRTDPAEVAEMEPGAVRGFRLPRSAAKLHRMVRILCEQRYVSAIE
ncbi:MAG: hypothetical protein GXP50_12260 [Deltaproteobacteria bacterium]|nr:hypothetical protein [Deltaproteobacteria bacterium]